MIGARRRRIPFPEERRPLLFAHRGLSSTHPENTLASFRAAREAGVPGVELDVHLTRDGHLAVIHDDTTARVAHGGQPPLMIEHSDWKDLAALDVGSWKGPGFAGERIPLLREVFEELGDAVYYDVELKWGRLRGNGLEAAVIGAIRDAGLAERCALSSFNPFVASRCRALAREMPVALIWSDTADLPKPLRHGGGRWIARPDYLKPHRAEALRLLSRGAGNRSAGSRRGGSRVPVAAWTVDDPQEARRLVDLGCDALISNTPAGLDPAWRSGLALLR